MKHSLMKSLAGFILKVVLASAGLSLLLKYIGPLLSIPATASNALIAVFAPPLLVAIALGWQAWARSK